MVILSAFDHDVKKASTTKGRKKIEIKKLEKVSNKQVTFSKRRNGLFKKASEICVLCKAHVAIVVFSPAGKVFCFGEPDVDSVFNRYLTGQTTDDNNNCVNPGDDFPYGDLNRQYEDGLKKLEQEKLRLNQTKEELESGKRVTNWWCDSIENKDMVELQHYTMFLQELRRNLAGRLDELMARASLLPSSFFYGAIGNQGGASVSNHHQYGNHKGLPGEDLNLGF